MELEKVTRRMKPLGLAAVVPAAALALMAMTACSANSKSKAAEEAPGQNSAGSAAQNAAKSDPGIDLNCVYDHLKNPPESFHYVYKKDAGDGFPVDQEADFTPQTIDGFRRQPDGSQQPLHAVHSDPQSWQGALAGLTGISGMSSAIALVHSGSALKREADRGEVNGYDTVHYSIDTARFDAAERQILGPTMGPGGFEKGDVWVTSQGCPVKLALDAELHKNDGSRLEKIHYEEAMVKK